MLDDLGKGTWIVIKKDNSTSARSTKKLEPKFEEIIAALHYLQDGMVNEMSKRSTMRPSSTLMSKKEQKAWATFKKTMGKDVPKLFEMASLHEISQAGIDYLQKHISEAKRRHIPVSELNEKTKQKKAKEDRENNSINDLEI